MLVQCLYYLEVCTDNADLSDLAPYQVPTPGNNPNNRTQLGVRWMVLWVEPDRPENLFPHRYGSLSEHHWPHRLLMYPTKKDIYIWAIIPAKLARLVDFCASRSIPVVIFFPVMGAPRPAGI